MITAMTFEEAFEKALDELAHRAGQMTEAEHQELLQDRTRELLGLPKLARLQGGRRLRPEEWLRLMVAVDNFLSDFAPVAQLGDARLIQEKTLKVLFRLSERPDIGCTVAIWMENMNFTEAGQHAAVKIYDTLTPQRVQRMLARGKSS